MIIFLIQFYINYLNVFRFANILVSFLKPVLYINLRCILIDLKKVVISPRLTLTSNKEDKVLHPNSMKLCNYFLQTI